MIPRWALALSTLAILGAVLAGVVLTRSTPAQGTAPIVAEPSPSPVPAPTSAPDPPRRPRWATDDPGRSAELVAASDEEPSLAPTVEPAVGAADEASRRAEAIEEAMRVARRRVTITMYSTSWCPHCERARAFLREQGLSFSERDVDESESAKRRLREINPRGGVPTFDVDGTVLVGFSRASVEASIERAARERALRMVGPP